MALLGIEVVPTRGKIAQQRLCFGDHFVHVKVVDEQWGQLLALSDALDFDLGEMPLEDLFTQSPSLEVGLDQFLLLGVKVFESPLDPSSGAFLLGPGIRHDVTDYFTQKGEHRGGN